jgi:hypothetical protein
VREIGSHVSKRFNVRCQGFSRAENDSVGTSITTKWLLRHEEKPKEAVMPAILVPIFLVGVPVMLVGGYYIMHVVK